MKKTLLLIIISMIGLSSFAQSKSTSGSSSSSSSSAGSSDLSIGIDGGLPLGNFGTGWSFGFGGTAKFAYNFSDMFALTLESGYMSFSGKTIDGYKAPSFGFIPIKVGARYTLNGGVYLEPQLGVTNVSASGASSTDFTYAINVGYRMTPGIDASVRYEGISNTGSISFIGLRVAYSFALGKK